MGLSRDPFSLRGNKCQTGVLGTTSDGVTDIFISLVATGHLPEMAKGRVTSVGVVVWKNEFGEIAIVEFPR